MEVKSSNPNALAELQKHLNKLAGVQGRVGWFENAQYEDGTPVAYVASIQEYGHGSIPPRLGMRSTANDKGAEWAQLAAAVSKQVIDGAMTATVAMELITAKAKGDMAKHIATVTSPPLSPVTILARAARARGEKVAGKKIGEIAGQVKNQRYDITMAQMAGVSTKPLIDTRTLFDNLNNVVMES